MVGHRLPYSDAAIEYNNECWRPNAEGIYNTRMSVENMPAPRVIAPSVRRIETVRFTSERNLRNIESSPTI